MLLGVSRHLHALFWLGLLALANWEDRRIAGARVMPPVEIFRGVTYECTRLPESAEGGGLAHIVRVDLAAPGIELYLTPIDPVAAEHGHQYRLAHADPVARQENLAVVVNGTLFKSDSFVLPVAGDWASAGETVVAQNETNHVDPNSYLLWFDAELVPRVEATKPPPQSALERARFAIGGQAVLLRDGRPRLGHAQRPDRRTLLGIDRDKKLLWLAVFERATFQLAATTLASRGAADAIPLDGGGSSTLFLGASRALPRSGCVVGGQRPIATFVGIRANGVGL
jgi:hypothetical protein